MSAPLRSAGEADVVGMKACDCSAGQGIAIRVTAERHKDLVEPHGVEYRDTRLHREAPRDAARGRSDGGPWR